MDRRIALLLMLLLPSGPLFAATDAQLALAAIGIAQARIELGKLQPQLPDNPPRAEAPETDPPIPEGLQDDKGRMDTAAVEGTTVNSHMDVAKTSSDDLQKALEAIAALQQEQQRLGDELQNRLSAPVKESTFADGTPPPSLYYDTQKVTVMICDGIQCSERSGKLKFDDSAYVTIGDVGISDSWTKEPGNITVTIDDKSYQGKLEKREAGIAFIRVVTNPTPVTEKIAPLISAGIPNMIGESGISPMSGMQPMQLVESTAVMGSAMGPISVTVYTADGIPEQTWCAPCNRFHKENKDGDHRISFTYIPINVKKPPKVRDHNGRLCDPSLPCMIWTGGDGTLMHLEGFHPLDEIYRIMMKPQNNPPHASNVAAAGPAGAIHAADQIRQMFAFYGQYVGDGKTSSFDWSKPQSKINLLALKDVEATDLFGRNGRIQIDSPDAIGLPVKSLAFGYRLVGNNIIIDAEPFTLQGIVDKLGLKKSKAMGVSPVGIIGIDDALLVWQIFSMIRDVVALLHPSADILIPDEVAGNMTLNGDTMLVKFDKPVTVKLVWVFTFPLAIKSVTITTSNIHVEFSGSRFIRSRDFAVSENLQSSRQASPTFNIVRSGYQPPPVREVPKIGFGWPYTEDGHGTTIRHLVQDHGIDREALRPYEHNQSALDRAHGWAHAGKPQ